MNLKAHYAHITKRIAACIFDQMTFFLIFNLFFGVIFSSIISVQNERLVHIILEGLMYVALEVLMITRFGWTPGKLLCGIYIKDANTLKNIVLMQVIIRSTLKALLFLSLYISEWFLILPIFILIPTIFDQRKQFFYDKIAKTVVTDYKTKECYLNYAGITRRIIAHIIDRLIIMIISLVCLIFIREDFHINEFELFMHIYSYLFFLLPIVFGVFMVKKLSGTPGQLLCGIHIKDSNTLKNITLIQAIIRHISFEVIRSPFIMKRKFFDKYISEWWLDYLSDLIFITMILIFICAIFDQRKQCLHDKIAKTIAIGDKL